MTEFVIAVDGGGSKTDVVAISLDGTVLASLRGAGSSPQIIGLESAVSIVSALVEQVAGSGTLVRTNVYLSGLDLPAEISSFERALAEKPWAANSVVDNDLFALLRAGTSEPNAIAVVCGTGINAVGVRADGATARFPALGNISGDWGGGWHLGEQAMWHAARGDDGRGPHTSLEQVIPAVYGLGSIREVIEALHFERLPIADLHRLAFDLLDAADDGDTVARAVVDRQVEEIVTMARVAMERLDLLDSAVPVVLGGGILAAGRGRLIEDVSAGLAITAPKATIELVRERPILGAALLALEAAGAPPAAVASARSSLSR